MVFKDPHFKSCEKVYTIDFSFSLQIQSLDKCTLSELSCKVAENTLHIFCLNQVVPPLHFTTVNNLGIDKSHQICTMQKVSRIFSTRLQFGTLKRTYLKI